ncbi:MAG TPA: membrane dipeptidase [Anaerolineales bacterium]|nr:membrane dipeptidase [Anaerolineales bacterium]
MSEPMLVDAHEDLAWNMLSFGRDYTFAAAETRRHEQGSQTPELNGDTLLGWPDYQQGRVAIVFSTLFAAPNRHKLGDWDHQCYANEEEAHAIYSRQLDAYDQLAGDHPDMFRKIEKLADLQSVLQHWQREDSGEHPVGLVVLMEGAEGVRQPGELEDWYQRGVRIIGPAWAGTRFCGGTREPGGLTSEGYALLQKMAELGYTLDLSHMDEAAALQALDSYRGSIIASHANALALLKGSDSNRHLTDQVIQGLLERGGTIGIVPQNSFLKPGWRETGGRASISLDYMVAQIDYICQMAGNALHVGIGSDFDGGFGLPSVPVEIDTIRDLRKLIPILNQKGYTQVDIAAILGKNWLVYLQNTLPEAV